MASPHVVPAIATPGQRIGPLTRFRSGPGTHMHDAHVHASLLGLVRTEAPATVSVSRDLGRREVLPEVGNVVLCRVVRIAPRQASVAILVCGDTVLDAEWQGLIRAQDVRATEKDRVKIYESFRPGDVVRAQVISLGDQANYYLSTAKNELGVLMATSEAGNTMFPLSWREFKDPETGSIELRKVAKPNRDVVPRAGIT